MTIEEKDGTLTIHGKSGGQVTFHGTCPECGKEINLKVDDNDYETREGEHEFIFFCQHCGKKYEHSMEVYFSEQIDYGGI